MPFNTTNPTLLSAFSAYTAPTVTKADWADQAVMAAKEGARDQITARIAAELIGQGADETVAKVAAAHFMRFGFAPNFGLDGVEDRRVAAAAGLALDRWIAGVVAAAQAHRVAA